MSTNRKKSRKAAETKPEIQDHKRNGKDEKDSVQQVIPVPERFKDVSEVMTHVIFKFLSFGSLSTLKVTNNISTSLLTNYFSRNLNNGSMQCCIPLL